MMKNKQVKYRPTWCRGMKNINVAADVKRTYERTSEYSISPIKAYMIFVFTITLPTAPAAANCMCVRFMHIERSLEFLLWCFHFSLITRSEKRRDLYYSISICRSLAFKMGFPFYQKKGIWCFLTFISKKLHNMQTQFNKFDVENSRCV